MARPVALVTNFSKTAFPRLLAEIEAGPRPPIADWCIGTYGISKPMADAIAAARFRYAPVFAIQPRTSKRIRERRRVRKAETELLDPEFAGKIPGGNAVLPPANQRAWGIEFGRRYRDYIRRQRSAGVRIDTWQFDEILGKCATSSAHRAFAGGILHGLANGRPELGDQHEKGFVWFGLKPLTDIPAPASGTEAARFWDEVAQATLLLVGEEYPAFHGSAEQAAREKAVGQQRLNGGLHPDLARKYVCLMTPGWTHSASLLGNVDDKPPAFVTDWRQGFIRARSEMEHPQGFGQFRFTAANLRPNERLRDAVASLHFANRQLNP